MAALATMTLVEMNRDRKKVFPLFQKTSKQQKPQTSEPKHDTEPRLPSSATNENEKLVSGEAAAVQGLPTTNNASGGAVQIPLLNVDLNEGRKKRRKTASPQNKATTLPPVESDLKEIVKPRTKEKGSRKSKVKKLHGVSGPDSLTKAISHPTLVSAKVATLNQEYPASGHEHPVEQISSDHSRPIDLTQEIQTEPATNLLRQHQKSQEIKNAGNGSNDLRQTNGDTEGGFGNKPKKMLQWNPKTGTIGSPPKTGLLSESRSKNVKADRKSRIIVVPYGNNSLLPADIGSKIDNILNNVSTHVEAAKPNKAAQKNMSNVSAKSPKPLHPLFGGKKPAKSIGKSEASEPPSMAGISSLHKPKPSGRSGMVSHERSSTPPKTVSSTVFGGCNGILRFPGAIEPAWPWEGMLHIRGTDYEPYRLHTPNTATFHARRKEKKSKYQAVEIPDREQIITVLSSMLNVKAVAKAVSEINPDEFPAVPPCLRIPTKHYEGGSALQQRVLGEICSPLKTYNTLRKTAINENEPPGSQVHPAISRVYKAIPATLSAFDQGKCESQAWTQKYAPKCASEILQYGREPVMLRNWLQTLVIQSVDTGGVTNGLVPMQAGSKRESSGKRKRKVRKVDSFIVSSDEEDNDLDEITDFGEELDASGGTTPLKRTVVRNRDVAAMGSKNSIRLTNAVVLSGPHGCGKTATVYAIANELGFEVFEINPGSRRSGKDIMEKVGDMTRNHQVQQSHHSAIVDEDNLRLDQALAKDLESGRQGKMDSFFKTKSRPQVKAEASKHTTALKKTDNIEATRFYKRPSKQQKQSLILIEEADIIFEEDKQFWQTTMLLLAQSKRPVIITCNDENSIPFQSLSLHGIFRFQPPPAELAIDYMLLLAACEGHSLGREAVSNLFRSRKYDLRASITDLNFWCQFAVGDVKNGLDWFYPRWPVGKDVDDRGETIRVVSEGTFQAGMGGLCQDNLESCCHNLDIDEEVLHQAWDTRNIDVGDWHETLDLQAWGTKVRASSRGPMDDRSALEMYENFTESMSMADICSGTTFAPDDRTLMDVDQPKMSPKVQEDYIQAYPILDVFPRHDFSSLPKDIALWIKSRVRNHLQKDKHVQVGFDLPAELNLPSEAQLNDIIDKRVSNPERYLCRMDFAKAFDPISEPEKPSMSLGRLDASAFDRNFSIQALDLAPYVRSIVANDNRLQQDRVRLSNLLSEGGRTGKRMRTTRAAMSALEGSVRSTTRKERYFGPALNSTLVLKTGMPGWTYAAEVEVAKYQADGKGRNHDSETDISNEEHGSSAQENSETEKMSMKHKKPKRTLVKKRRASFLEDNGRDELS